MREGNIKILGLILVLTFIEPSTEKSKEQEKMEMARRSLLRRETEFIRKQPLSVDLKLLISKYKRKDNENKVGQRRKRSDNIDTNLLYVVQDGHLVPFRNLNVKRDNEKTQGEPEGYTVVPLVIPLKAPETKLVKTRTLDDDTSNDVPKLDFNDGNVINTSSSTVSSDATEFNQEEDTNRTKEETVVLNKILEDVQSLMHFKHEGSMKEGVLCNLNGSWISDAAGMRFDLIYQQSTRKKFKILISDRIPPNEDGFMCDGNWSVFGELPFMHSGMVIVLAVHDKDKHLAFFIGECRICEGTETVSGTWLIGRTSRDCKDQKEAYKIISDLWKREQAHTLRKKHLLKIGQTVDEGD